MKSRTGRICLVFLPDEFSNVLSNCLSICLKYQWPSHNFYSAAAIWAPRPRWPPRFCQPAIRAPAIGAPGPRLPHGSDSRWLGPQRYGPRGNQAAIRLYTANFTGSWIHGLVHMRSQATAWPRATRCALMFMEINFYCSCMAKLGFIILSVKLLI